MIVVLDPEEYLGDCPLMVEQPADAEHFIARWQGREGGQERANYALFLSELCDLLQVERPHPAAATHDKNDYVFERAVTRHKNDGDTIGRIDLYRRGSFVLEAKQSRLKGGNKEVKDQNDHDELDVAVAEAYGWPADQSDDDILVRLVALNKERAAEEKRGLVRWLRPDYQIPRFAKEADSQAAKEDGTQVAVEPLLPDTVQKLAFPSGAVDQTAVVFAMLAAAGGPLDAAAIAGQFRKTRTTERKIAEVLASLARLGHVTSADGKSFALRKIA